LICLVTTTVNDPSRAAKPKRRKKDQDASKLRGAPKLLRINTKVILLIPSSSDNNKEDVYDVLRGGVGGGGGGGGKGGVNGG